MFEFAEFREKSQSIKFVQKKSYRSDLESCSQIEIEESFSSNAKIASLNESMFLRISES